MPEPERPVYFFVHIPKTAGQSLRSHLWRYVRPPEERILRTKAIDVETNDSIRALTQEELSRVDLVVGHGVTRKTATFFPARPARFFTVLRDPVDLAVSQYNWNFKDPNDDAPTFEGFMRGFRNRMCVWIAERFEKRQRRAPAKEIHETGELFEAAKSILDGFFCVGVQSHMKESLAPVYSAFNAPDEMEQSTHVSGVDFPKRITRTPEIEETVRALCRDDMKLYQSYN